MTYSMNVLEETAINTERNASKGKKERRASVAMAIQARVGHQQLNYETRMWTGELNTRTRRIWLI